MSLAEIAASKLSKTEKDAQAISSAMKSNFLFQHLNSAQKNELISLMQVLPVKAGDWIITQGDIGDKFYLVDNGRFEVRVRAENSEEQNGGNVVHVYDSGNDQHPGFGELALLYNKPRAASVIALTTGKLWFLDYKNFKRTVMRCIYIYIYIFMYMHLYIYKYIKSLVSGLQKLQKNSHEVCICRYVFIYIHIYICIHIYIYI
jgi:CRP-like cAMP-binding protein